MKGLGFNSPHLHPGGESILFIKEKTKKIIFFFSNAFCGRRSKICLGFFRNLKLGILVTLIDVFGVSYMASYVVDIIPLSHF